MNTISAIVHYLSAKVTHTLQNKKALSNLDNAHLVEHLENSSPLIIDEVHRWHVLLWDDYLDYKYGKERSLEELNP